MQLDKTYTTEQTGIEAKCSASHGGHSFMTITGGKYDGLFFVVGPSGRVAARHPKLCGLHLNLAGVAIPAEDCA